MSIIGKRLVGKRIRHHPYLAIDTENRQDGSFILGCLYGKTGVGYGKIVDIEKVFTDRWEMQKYLMGLREEKDKQKSTILIGWNVGYDAEYLKEILDEKTRIETNGRLLTIRLKNGLKVVDAMNYTRRPLASWITSLKMEEQGITKIEFGDGKAEGLSQEMLTLRCMNDAKATYRFIEWLEDFIVYDLKIPLGLTTAKNALTLWSTHHAKEVWERDDKYNEFERKAYRGGRAEVFKKGEKEVFQFDVNGMYLSVMRDNYFPNPSSVRHYETGEGWREFFDNYNMILDCVVEVPEQYIAPLPYRTPAGKLIFPTGTFRGCFTSPELIESSKYGVRVLKVFEYNVYGKSGDYFKSFAEYVNQKRQEFKKSGNKAADEMIKDIGNSLYGKFGQTNYSTKYIPLEDYDGDISGKEIIYSVDGIVYVIEKENPEDTQHTAPVLSLFITSYARIKLLKWLKEFEPYVVYCDTDSIHLTEKVIEGSNEIGELKFEGTTKQHYYTPKYYGEKHKGVPKRAEKIYEDEHESIWKFTKPIKRKEGIRQKKVVNSWVEHEKILTKIDTKRVWNEEKKDSRPIDLTYKDL